MINQITETTDDDLLIAYEYDGEETSKNAILIPRKQLLHEQKEFLTVGDLHELLEKNNADLYFKDSMRFWSQKLGYFLLCEAG